MKKLLGTVGLVMLTGASAVSKASSEVDFPFQEQAFQFRLNQGFFRASGELFEDILKASRLVDENNVLRLQDSETGRTSHLKYRQLKSSIRLVKDAIVGTMNIDIADSRFFIAKHLSGSMLAIGSSNDCSMSLRGPMQFEVRMEVAARGHIDVDLPTHRFNDTKLQVAFSGCGLAGGLGNMLGVDGIRGMLHDYLKKTISSVANDQELRVVAPADMDKALKAANVFINVPSRGPIRPRTASYFKVNVGLMGYLSNARGSERLRITNPGRPYLNELGMQWSLDAGVQANSKNIYNPRFRPSTATSRAPFPEWGYVPYTRTGKAVDFDAGLMIRTSFLRSMFETLYQAGFFNMQVQDSLLNKKVSTLNTTGWGEVLGITLPNGQKLTRENYGDSRMELRLSAPPALTVKNAEEFQMVVPDFHLAYFVKAKGQNDEFEVLRVRAKFHLLTRIGMDQNARLSFTFNEHPVQDFQVLSRSGISPEVPDRALEEQLNQAVVALLNEAAVDIPFLKGRKIAIAALGIDATQKSDQALSLYLKIK